MSIKKRLRAASGLYREGMWEDAPVPSADPSKAVVFQEDFHNFVEHSTGKGGWDFYEIQSSGEASATITKWDTDAGAGHLKLETGNAENDAAQIQWMDGMTVVPDDFEGLWWEARFMVPVVASTSIHIGMAPLNTDISLGSPGGMHVYATSAVLYADFTSNDSETIDFVGTGSIANQTFTRVGQYWDPSDGSLYSWQDDVLFSSEGSAHDSVVDSDEDLMPFIAVIAGTTTNSQIYVEYFKCVAQKG